MALFWGQKASLKGTPGDPGPAGPMAPVVLILPSPTGNERQVLLQAPQPLTISRISAVLVGGSNPSVSFSLQHGSDVSAAGTAVTAASIVCSSSTSGTEITGLDNPLVAEGCWLWAVLSASTGSPAALTIQIDFS